MNERSAILEEDATSAPPEEALEPTTPVDEPQPSSTEQIEPSPEDQPPAEPPKKETGWSKHKGKILVAIGILAVVARLVLRHSQSDQPETNRDSYHPDTLDTPPFPEPELSESFGTCESVFDPPPDVSNATTPPDMELCRESVRSHPRLLHLGQDASPEKKAELEASGHPLTNGDRNYTNVNKFDRDVLRPAKKERS